MDAVTWNPNDKTSAHIVLSEENYLASNADNYTQLIKVRATLGRDTGKFYFETDILVSHHVYVGISNAEESLVGVVGSFDGCGYCVSVDDGLGHKRRLGYGPLYGGVFEPGDTIGIAVDLDAHSIEFFINGVSQGVAYTTLTANMMYFPAAAPTAPLSAIRGRFRSVDFLYAPPEGYSPWDPTEPGVSSEVESYAYEVAITGLNSNLPLESIQATIRNGTPSYTGLTIPTADLEAELVALIGAEMKVKKVITLTNGSQITQEISNSTLKQVSTEQTALRGTTKLVGYKQTTYGAGQAREINIEGYTIDATGKRTIKGTIPATLINPGDQVELEGDSVIVGSITYQIGRGVETMQITEA